MHKRHTSAGLSNPGVFVAFLGVANSYFIYIFFLNETQMQRGCKKCTLADRKTAGRHNIKKKKWTGTEKLAKTLKAPTY